jgi:hypothetical protein
MIAIKSEISTMFVGVFISFLLELKKYSFIYRRNITHSQRESENERNDDDENHFMLWCNIVKGKTETE